MSYNSTPSHILIRTLNEYMSQNEYGSIEDKPSFDEWYKECDKIVTGILGLGVDDLPDAQWMDYYHDDMSPFDAVDTANIDYWDGQLPL